MRKHLLLVVGVALLVTACYPGVYAVDVFPEMHYQPSYRPYEPPRLSAADSAVPITGKPIEPADFGAATELSNPVPPSLETSQRAETLFRVNCLPCHGPEGRGDGRIAQYFQSAQLPPPVDFASVRARSRSDGQLYFIIANGLGNMPSFGRLLTPDERWHLVYFIRGVQAKNPPS